MANPTDHKDFGDIAWDESTSGKFRLLRNFKPELPIGRIVVGPRQTTFEFKPRKLTVTGSLSMSPKQMLAFASLLDILSAE